MEKIKTLKPIIIEGKAKEKMIKLLDFIKIGSATPIYLWNQTSDPNFSPNDYIQLEAPNQLVFSHVLTTCSGIVPLVESPIEIKPKDVYLQLDKECREHTLETIEDVDSFDEFQAEILEEIFEQEVEKKAVDIKIKDAFKQVQEQRCQHLNTGKCQKRHYLVGMGKIINNEVEYVGIHVYLFPEIDTSDLEDPKIKDEIFERFKKNGSQIKTVVSYYKELSCLLKSI